MENTSGFTTKDYTKPRGYKKPNRKRLIIIAILCISLIYLIFFIQYKTAPQIAQNKVAIYLSKNYNPKNKIDFMSFKKVYASTKIIGFKYVVELSGSANVGYGDGKYSFYAKTKITPFTNKVTIEKITLNDKKIKK